ncbi:hypothetical protein [Xanthomonas sp. 1678]|uniref:hypothetical protein n=1 Tax=Xanthomonas sp. 1678 TaxID=3158788 RepID=UPI00285FFDEF|nr:hypothetical protein [Xanthomonas translucens]
MDLPSLHTLPREDRLYRLLPAVHRIRDAEQGYPLQALLRVIAEQMNLVEDDIARLYDNWFIETAEDWAVPYLADLLGYRPVEAALGDGAGGQALERVRVPRREVAHLISQRRRKGTVSLLEDLAFDVGGWPARAQEYFRLLDRAQHPSHLHTERLGTADLRDMRALDRCDRPFDTLAHSADLRRIQSRHRRGRHNVPSVGVHVWRTRSYPVTRTPAYCVEDAGAHCFTFSVLGQDAPLYRKPRPEPDAFHQADEQNLPLPLRRRDLRDHLRQDYGADASLAIWAEQWAGQDGSAPVPVEAIVVADLSGWRYRPPRGKVAVDPQRGRLMFPPDQVPKKGVRVSYHYGFAADLGGGEYPRPARRPPPPFTLYRVGQGGASSLPRLGDALRKWEEEAPAHAVIELMHSGVWVEPVHVRLRPGQSLMLCAAPGTRPVIRLIDWQTDLPDALGVELDVGSRFALEGILLAGRPMQVSAPHDPRAYAEQAAKTPACGAELAIRHCTLVPGWGIGCDCAPERASEPSLELLGVQARVQIEHSIVGSIQVRQDEVGTDPIALVIADSIIDAAGSGDAIGAMDAAVAHVRLTLRDSTVLGQVQVHAVELAENSVFDACLNVARRQIGCVRHSHIPCHCRSPRRYRCQPDEVTAAVRARHLPEATEQTLIGAERQRVQPRFQSRRYGLPGYARLTPDSALEIRRGADDGSEMGAYHDLYEPQREANLRARLDQHTPAGMTVGLLFAD